MHSLGTKDKIDKECVERIIIPSNTKVLDICSGSGDISIEIARKHNDVQLTSLDASAKMLEVAKQKAKDLHNIKYIQGDALKLPFDDNSFDVAVISFGLRNLEDLEQGLKEMQNYDYWFGAIAQQVALVVKE